MNDPLFPNLRSHLNVAILLTSLFATLAIAAGDYNEYIFIQINGLGSRTNDLLWASLTILGDTRIVLATLLLFFLHHNQVVWTYMLLLIPGGILIQGLKRVLSWDRPVASLDPSLVHVIGEPLKGNTFPSGHTAALFAFAAIIVSANLPRSLRFPILVIALAASISRISVGAHWPMDVTAGAFLGYCSGLGGIYAYRHFDKLTHSSKGLKMIWFIIVIAAGSIFFQKESVYPSVDWFGYIYVGTCLTIGVFLYPRNEASYSHSQG